MGSREVIVVSDAGPLIHLAEIDCLQLLSIFKSLHIPDAIWLETVGRNRVSQADLVKLGNVQRYTLFQSEVTQFIEKHDLMELDAGEQECLCLCEKAGISILLTDDLAVRDAAQTMHLWPVGSLGIVVRAYHLGIISLAEAVHHINELYIVSSLFVTRTIVELAIEQLDQ